MPIRKTKPAAAEASTDWRVRRQLDAQLDEIGKRRADEMDRLAELLARDDLDEDETEELEARIENYKRERRRNRMMEAGEADIRSRWERKSVDPTWLAKHLEHAIADHRPSWGPTPHTFDHARGWYLVTRLIALQERAWATFPPVDWDDDGDWSPDDLATPMDTEPAAVAPETQSAPEPAKKKRRSAQFGVVGHIDDLWNTNEREEK